jgi:diacylglycerol kinase (ATP)
MQQLGLEARTPGSTTRSPLNYDPFVRVHCHIINTSAARPISELATKRIAVIRNPASGRGAGARSWGRVRELLDQGLRGYGGVALSVSVTSGTGDALELARNALRQGADLLVAAGGDGTVAEVATALEGTSAALAVLPLGTGNDFARALGVEHDLDLAVRTVFQGRLEQVDAVRWELPERGEQGRFVNVAGCGFDAGVAARINEGFRFIGGTAAYVAAVFDTLRRYKPVELTIEVDGEVSEHNVMLCAVANATMYGGGMKVAPEASIKDGLLDVVVVGELSKAEFVRAFPGVFKGKHIGHPKVKVLRGRSVVLRSPQPIPLLADGEVIGDTPVRFDLQPAALRALMAAQSA